MSLHDRPTSVLNRNHKGPGYHDKAVADQLDHQTEHHQDQMAAMAAGTDEDFGPKEDTPYPKHVHSTKAHGDHFVVNNEGEHATALESGDWSDTPLEVVKE